MAHQQTQSNEQRDGITGLEIIVAPPVMQIRLPEQPTEAGVPSQAGRKRGRPVGSGSRGPRAQAPPPPPFPWSIFYGGDSKPVMAILPRGEDLEALLESVALKESRALRINSAQGRLSLVSLSPQGPSSPLSYEGQWEILSLTGAIVPGNNVGKDHPLGGVTIRFSGQMGEVIEGRINGPVIVDTAVVVSMTSFNFPGEAKPKRRRRTGPKPAGPVPATEGALPVEDEAPGEEQDTASAANAGHDVRSEQEGIPSSASPSLERESLRATVNPSNEKDVNPKGC
ncbi:PPC domain [Dillenia turbinata]|uniref:AT-hook motif nuclear-localized protein n=1 Tax=Dillenia turbinata TaxID=194707 RepID=A0AAN8Z881_9MAGN